MVGVITIHPPTLTPWLGSKQKDQYLITMDQFRIGIFSRFQDLIFEFGVVSHTRGPRVPIGVCKVYWWWEGTTLQLDLHFGRKLTGMMLKADKIEGANRGVQG